MRAITSGKVLLRKTISISTISRSFVAHGKLEQIHPCNSGIACVTQFGSRLIHTHVFPSTRKNVDVDWVRHHSTRASAPKSPMSIVFTDIVKSTSLWESDASAMEIALHQHDDVVRELTQKHQGYEVKQNGDGFMIAFPTAMDAISFCLDAQDALLHIKWPTEILDLPPGRTINDDEDHLLFRGLRMRMSAHWGNPVCNWNPVIERMDYLGPLVNRTARFIEVCEGGQIVISEVFLKELWTRFSDVDEQGSSKPPSECQLSDLLQPRLFNLSGRTIEVSSLGKHQFKGISEKEKLYFIVSHSLHGRINLWPKNQHISGSKGNVPSDAG